MAPRKRVSDDFIDDDESGENAPRSKKAKVGKEASSHSKKKNSGDTVDSGKQKDNEGNSFWEVYGFLIPCPIAGIC